MASEAAGLVARPFPDAIGGAASPPALRAMVASLARGGAERIVIEWLGAEAARGRAVELAILHRRAHEYRVPPGITVHRRGTGRVEVFVEALAAHWRAGSGPVSCHLVPDALLARLWLAGVATVPVLHNAREGWRNDPAAWPPEHVPLAIACADSVRRQAVQAGCRVPVVALRHRPRVGAQAGDPAERARIRGEWNIAPGTLAIGVVGAFKAQKDHARAVEVLARVRRRREACLVILGGALDAAGLAELGRTVSRAAALGVSPDLRLPGFVDPVEPWYAAFDALLNVSRHEGLSMATREALGAGLPVVAADVGGQGETSHPRLHLLPAGATPSDFAARLAGLPVRVRLDPERAPRFPRAWSVAASWRPAAGPRLDTLFVTANLNAGGAQRSLVNLAQGLAGRHRFAIAVAGGATHGAFPAQLARAGVECFRPAASADAFEVAEGILAHAAASGARNLCFWNADARVKLLAARFAPPALRLLDVSPGAYAWEELRREEGLADALAFGPAAYYRRLDRLVTKFDDRDHPPCKHVAVIANGVALREPARDLPGHPCFLVSGRIAPSKRLQTILAAFERLATSRPDAQLVIAGQAEPRHREYLDGVVAGARGLPVEFLGARPDLGFLAEPFTAAVVLGTHQGCPNAVLEALSAGIPVIANASGGTGELVRDGRTGWLLPEACTAEEIARAMAEAAADPGAARRRGLAGRDLVARHHSLEGMALRYLSLLAPDLPQPDFPARTASDDLPELRPA
ncbi:MAG TPA: glycosyltransferase [Usitatibacteraceae bacterium]|jgi:glycosyltransferase involved in cell wall biosynthesis|nr:glycosyltransferase [Burkholderiales bacterium]HQY46234.1 glycosyltransferase [Usitatibacteraceae bacterium]HRA22628.1 glycosyltransferase [Usitatibacteraceae bacterium]